MLSTQFEAIDARRALTCIDGSGLKSTFDLATTACKSLTVIGNMT